MEGETKTELVFIPYPGRGHLMSTLELVKLLIGRDQRLSATVLVIKPPFDPKTGSQTLESGPRIRFVNIPPAEPQSSPYHPSKFIESHKDHVQNEAAKLFGGPGLNTRLAGFVVDIFCTSMADVARGLGVPTYVFFTSGAAVLGHIMHFQGLVDNENRDLAEYVNSRDEIPCPSYELPIPTELLPPFMLGKDGGPFVDIVRRARQARGIIVNTFRALEPKALDYLSGDARAPQVYPVGPLLHIEGREVPKHDEVMEWLDRQPDSSVVFLCFGSMRSFDGVQAGEIARALENGGWRFLWSLRKPPPVVVGPGPGTPTEYEDFNEVLPEGFVGRTEGFGRVIGWAPQAEVLAHRTVGGFVSHCGWNSTLESVWGGVPMAAWPMYAEQPLNGFQLARDLGVAVEVNLGYRKGANMVVGAEEIGRAIARMMEAGGREVVRVRMEKLGVEGRAAVAEGGSSFEAVGKFIKDVMDDVASRNFENGIKCLL
ncbi:UDP-glycosyltransferase 71B7 [Striga hermonthica]|uniref:Glycosyltransferase n=1 Tax=Striga hermonthica TaxID=68872 RepID=A0A9N7MS33_STRHE|nr:UDP-glycosyltransferase 71B7 [Striga hermonthica]